MTEFILSFFLFVMASSSTLASLPSDEEVMNDQIGTQKFLDMGGFTLRNWPSNSPVVMESISPGQCRSAAVKQIKDHKVIAQSTNALSVTWIIEGDFIVSPFRIPSQHLLV